MEEIKKETRERMEKAWDHVQNQVKKMRTGGAQSGLVEGLKVSSYGGERELKHLATISCPDARSILISPWDQNLSKEITSAIIKSDLGMAPQQEGKGIRLKVPELTEERREELIRTFKKEMEKIRVELRQIRKIMNEKVRKALKEKLIGEDKAKETEEDIQKITDQFIEKINELSEKKQKELMQV